MQSRPLGHKRALVIAIEVLRGHLYSQETRSRAADALEKFCEEMRKAEGYQKGVSSRHRGSQKPEARSQKAKAIPCPDCHIGTLAPADGRLVCDTCGWS